MDLTNLNVSLGDSCMDFLAGAPVIYHCHHFNLFLDQTIDDALGPEEGSALRRRVATDAWHSFLSNLVEGIGARTPAERLAAAQEIFSMMGHGKMAVNAGPNGGTAEGEFLHYSVAWTQKYGNQVRRLTPVDADACGFAAAAAEVAHHKETPFEATEIDCFAMEKERCTFEITPGTRQHERVVHQEDVTPLPALSGVAEERIRTINEGLRGFLSGVAGDQRGLVEAFGVFVTRHLPNYYNGISYGVIQAIRDQNPELVPMVEELLRESGHVCVFNTFGGILYSPEWDGMVGRVQGDLEEVVSGCTAIARALGFGAWTIEELEPTRLVIRTASEYESPWCIARTHGTCDADCYFLQGAAVAFMRLATSIDWQERPALTQDLYNQLFRGAHGWKVTQTHSLARGAAFSRVVVEQT